MGSGIRFFICLILSLSGAKSWANSCRVDELTQNCEVFRRESRERIPLGNGTFVLNPLKVKALPIPTVTLSPAELATRTARLKELFRYSQRQMIEQVTGGRPTSALNEAERSLVERIRRTRVEIDPDSGAMGGSNSGMSVLLDGGLLTAPEGLAVAIMAHELGHSVDTCTLHGPVFERSRRFTPEEVGEQLVTEKVGKGGFTYLESRYAGDGESAVKIYRHLIGEENLPLVSQRSMMTHAAGARVLQEQLRRGNLKESLPAVSPAHDPARPVLQCLTESGPLAQAMKPLERLRPEEAGVPARDPELAAHCLSQASEVSADIWGAKVMAAFLKENPPQSEIEKLGLLTPATFETCRDQRRTAGRQPAGRARDAHASFKDRFEQIFMDEPTVQEALGCTSSGSRQCMQRFRGTASGRGVTNEPRSSGPPIDARD